MQIKNSKSVSSVLTICLLVCVFVAFVFGTLLAQGLVVPEIGETFSFSLEWSACAPYLVFMILAFLLALIKFCLCTIPYKKEYPSKDTIKIQVFMEVINLLVLLLGCLSLLFINKTMEEFTGSAIKNVVGVIIVSSLALPITIACAGLTYHNYR